MTKLENISIMLLNPKRSGNVGSVARVMKNFGLSELIVVSKREVVKTFQAKKMAVHASDILDRAKIFLNLEEAVGNFQIIIGTTGKFHKDAPTELCLENLGEILTLTESNRIAFLFGPEDRGLSGEELSLCNYALTIPTSKNYPSLNLSHAACVVAYELFRQRDHGKDAIQKKMATKASMELLYSKMKELYLEIGFLDKINPERIMKLIRRIYDRSALEDREVRILLGIIKQTKWFLNKKD